MCEVFNGNCSPIAVDVLGNGFLMTDAEHGVSFDLDNDSENDRIGWTVPNSDDAWLVMDRDGNGVIDGGRELFGNTSPQMPLEDGEEMNGFRALALYDQTSYGGNGDGTIDNQDVIFERLRLWQDENHDGISETCEIHSLLELGLSKIGLDYKKSRLVDEFGNEFRYRAKTRRVNGSEIGRWAWDVFLVLER
jgi:hypothetical protein